MHDRINLAKLQEIKDDKDFLYRLLTVTLDEGIEVLRRILKDTELHARVDKPEPDADPAQIEYKAKAFFVGMTHVRELINERFGENDWDFHETNH